MKKFICLLIAALTLNTCMVYKTACAEESALNVSAPSCILVDYSTGTVLYEKNPDERRPLASVTKIMTMLLAMEEISDGNMDYDDIVTGSAHAKGYGGSTIFLDEGEQLSVRDILKGIAVASGNDAAAAIAEHICGTEDAFVQRMNKRASELGMTNTNFVNSNGLDAEGHYSSARDIAIMSRELMKHDDIFQFTGIWMDSLRNGQFTLSNTNKLIRFYDGATGLKTGSTSKAGFCISATAKRGNMHLIAVIMGAETSKARNADASSMLNYGFANYEITELVSKEKKAGDITVEKGRARSAELYPAEDYYYLKCKNANTDSSIELKPPKKIKAPVKKNQSFGSLNVNIDGKNVKNIKLICREDITKLNFKDFFITLIGDWLS